MPKLNFLAAFGIAEAKNALNAFTGVLVRFDPKTAGEADIRLLSAEVEKTAKLKVEAADDLKQLHTHHDRLEANRSRALAALSVLKMCAACGTPRSSARSPARHFDGPSNTSRPVARCWTM